MARPQGKAERFQVSLALQTHAYLARLAAKGTHGSKPTDVARTLIEEGVRVAIEKGFLNAVDVSQISAPASNNNRS